MSEVYQTVIDIKAKLVELSGFSNLSNINQNWFEILVETDEELQDLIQNYLSNNRSLVHSIMRFRHNKIDRLNISYNEFIAFYNQDRLYALQRLFQEPINNATLKSLEMFLSKGDTIEMLFELHKNDPYRRMVRFLTFESIKSVLDRRKNSESIRNLEQLAFPYISSSWTIFSPCIAVKALDKSSFIQGSGIPKDIRCFFLIDNLQRGEKKHVRLIYNTIEYSAYFIMSNEENPRSRIFWDRQLINLLQSAYKDFYESLINDFDDEIKETTPTIQFNRHDNNIDDYTYTIFLSEHCPNTIKHYISAATFNEEWHKLVEDAKNENKEKRLKKLSMANKKPEVISVLTNQYKRNQYVVIEVLDRANGFCERCKKPAPFIKASDNTPYLEVHHLIPLSKNGEDTIENSIAACPNCHREMHFGKDNA